MKNFDLPRELLQARAALLHQEFLFVRDQLAASQRWGNALRVKRWTRHMARLRVELKHLAVQRRALNLERRRLAQPRNRRR